MFKLTDLWCYEAVRLREHKPPALDDRSANEQALSTADKPARRLLARARVLARATQLQVACQDASTIMRFGALAACLFGVAVGISAALASLGDSSQPVNVLWTLISLLLIPTIMLLVWLGLLLIPSAAGGWFGRVWQFTVGRLLKSDSRSMAWQAWLFLMRRAQAERWWFALLTHTVWLSVLLGMLLGMLAAFSLRHYTFVWQTTWLADDVFVTLAQTIGAWPGAWGLTMPDVQTIRASGNVALDYPTARLAWANWLVGAVTVFGLLPRFVAVIVSGLMLRHLYRRLDVRLDDAYAIAIQNKLDRLTTNHRVDGPPGPSEQWPQLCGIAPEQASAEAVVAVLETSLDECLYGQFDAQTTVLPQADDRTSRKQAQEQLSMLKPRRLLIVVDAKQTPDRGLIRTILALGSQAVSTKILLQDRDDQRAKLKSWGERLSAIGLPLDTLGTNELLSWLKGS